MQTARQSGAQWLTCHGLRPILDRPRRAGHAMAAVDAVLAAAVVPVNKMDLLLLVALSTCDNLYLAFLTQALAALCGSGVSAGHRSLLLQRLCRTCATFFVTCAIKSLLHVLPQFCLYTISSTTLHACTLPASTAARVKLIGGMA